jgi:opacity protein-like surface antigen
MNFDSPSVNLNNQTIGAHGISVSTSAGYNFALANNWFIEPSAGFVWSKTKVDSFNSATPDGFGGSIGSTTVTNDVTSEIGRLSLRVGTTIATPKVVYQPFATASVFHEFAGDVVSTSSFCPTCAVIGDPAVAFQFSNRTQTTRVGTYGQYSLGLAAQVVNTGWLGFVRADYRRGDNIDGYAGNVGLRYQFAPDPFVAPVRYAKAPAIAPAVGPTNWTGFYVGVFAGGAYGRTDIAFANDPGGANTSPYAFGPLGGVQAGYNHQVNNWVFGVEGDFGLARIHGARTCGTDDGFGNVNGFNPFYQNCNDRINWMATAAARLGYAWGRTLFYVKGGGAWADGRVKVDCIDSLFTACLNPSGTQYPVFNANFTETTWADYNRFGWLVGYGTEFDLGKNWSAKAEYDYIQFGKQTQLASDGQTLLYSRMSISQVKVGLNYRFGGERVVADAPAMYTKAPAKAPVVASIYDWNGFYVGGNVGGGISSKNWEFFDEFGTSTQNGLPGFAGEGTHAASGPIAGGQVGYRLQYGRAVFGVEAQGNWANLKDKNESFLSFGPFGDVNNTQINSLGIFTGQVGYTAFDTLLYVKGGAVVVKERYDVTDFATGILKSSLNDTRWGAAVGAGLEYGFTPNWIAGIDYVHGFLGTKTLNFPDLINGGLYETERIRQRLDLVTLRLNYKFGPGVVVAKY